MRNKKNGIALLITVMFVMVISVAIGYGLSQINKASELVKEERLLYQTSVLLEDILGMLQNSQDLHSIADSNDSISDLNMFLSQMSIIPLSADGIDILITISSARNKLNINDINNTKERKKLQEYLSKYMINDDYVTLLLDNMGGIKEDGSYNSAIFEQNPLLFRDYIASLNHLKKINEYYISEYHDNHITEIDFKKLFYFPKDKNTTTKIDLNYATPEVWELMLGCQRPRAEMLSANGGFYTTVADLHLSRDENKSLEVFPISFFEPYLNVHIELDYDGIHTSINFEYDIKHAKGSHFVYEL